MEIPDPAEGMAGRALAEQALSRAAGTPLLGGNRAQLLYDSGENFPAWLEAIHAARTSVYIEMYLFADDAFGRTLRDALAERARAGVEVRLLVDWFGCARECLAGFFRPLQAAGAQVRAYNPPSLSVGLGFVGRNHRKQIIVDAARVFVGGLCASSRWEGDASAGVEPWRDTGVVLAGPVLAEALAAFSDSWVSCGGEPLPAASVPAAQGGVAARLIATTPSRANLMRLDLMIAAFARETLWITDAYFMATGTYLSALQNAARDGVDVRLLVPRSSDIGWIATVSRTQYRPLLEAGVRVFEWNGPMIHAKTAVADARWARIGSSNLNVSSWLANRELDVSIEDAALAGELAARFYQDLDHATEVVLGGKRGRPVLSQPRRGDGVPLLNPVAGAVRARATARAAARQAARIGDTLGAVVRGTRELEASEASALLTLGASLMLVAIAVGFFPWLAAAPVLLLLSLGGVTIVARSLQLYRQRRACADAAAGYKNAAVQGGKPAKIGRGEAVASEAAAHAADQVFTRDDTRL
ncbi:phospholipase D-like domain-containing protein [Crenobacter caeni]|uniref:Cardiolipin synthase B n=1 Tax=Crenobacter caeni TaxID=2705474 RepID=A0A6B2KTC8_9NEIS|nr:phospholipase D-like domain-containing protein [Crenobacter caeni]NDV13283.1 cardiolipin synthase B [Crenobacter caeni]